jgi:hypothetical protein
MKLEDPTFALVDTGKFGACVVSAVFLQRRLPAPAALPASLLAAGLSAEAAPGELRSDGFWGGDDFFPPLLALLSACEL